MEDPFLLDQNRVEAQLFTVRQKLQRWRQLRDADPLPEDEEEQEELEEEYRCLTDELSQSVKSIGWDLDDLQETLQMMLDANAPQVATDHPKRLAFVVKSRGFLEEVSREVSMVTGKSVATNGDARKLHHDVEAGSLELEAKTAVTWSKSTDQMLFPSVDLNSLKDLRMSGFHNRDWAGFFYRYRYLLAMLAIMCLIVFFTVVALAAKHTAARGRLAAVAAAMGTTTPSSLTTQHACKHYFCLGES